MVKKKNNKTGNVPCDVPHHYYDDYQEHLAIITKGTGRLFMFAADQKIEHLNQDFYGSGIAEDALDPEHIFRIANRGHQGALATHVGLIARYGARYKNIHYIAKLNGKTNLGNMKEYDPVSACLWDVCDVLELAQDSAISICGIGCTVYLGSQYERSMLEFAARMVWQAHQAGLVAVLWVYPRARHIQATQDPALIAGAAGVANALGADFVKVHAPYATQQLSAMQALNVASRASGNTQLIVAGGSMVDPLVLLETIHEQLTVGHTGGCAIGRNIFQRSFEDAVALSHAIASLVYEGASVSQAHKILNGNSGS